MTSKPKLLRVAILRKEYSPSDSFYQQELSTQAARLQIEGWLGDAMKGWDGNGGSVISASNNLDIKLIHGYYMLENVTIVSSVILKLDGWMALLNPCKGKRIKLFIRTNTLFLVLFFPHKHTLTLGLFVFLGDALFSKL